MATWTSEDLAAIEKAIANGVLSLEFGGKKVQYRSLEEMQKIRNEIRKALGLGGKGGRRVASFSKGTR